MKKTNALKVPPITKERDMYPLVRDWLTASGYQIHVELFDADVVGVKGDHVVVVEMKRCCSYSLLIQMLKRATWADEVWGCVASRPKAMREYAARGFGMLEIRRGKIHVRKVARPQPWQWHRRRNYRMKKLAARPPAMDHEVAGLPSCRELREQRKARTGKDGRKNEQG